jgi:hypothetical protein
LVGKKYYRKVTDNVTWVVKVLSETKTHVYIKVIKPLDSKHRWNVSKDWFDKYYKEIVSS